MLRKERNEKWLYGSYRAPFRVAGCGRLLIRESRTQYAYLKEQPVRVRFLLQSGERCRVKATGLVCKLLQQMIQAIKRCGQPWIVLAPGILLANVIGRQHTPRFIAQRRYHL